MMIGDNSEATMKGNVAFENLQVPATADVEIEIKLRAQVNITATTAQRKVSRFMLDRVSNLLCGNPPTLIVGERLHWRVPIWLGFPARGLIGKVGEMDVDVETGELIFTDSLLAEIGRQTDALAQRTLSGTK
jgi:hypothetical protein